MRSLSGPRALARFLCFAAVALLTRAVLLGVPTVDLDEAVCLTGARQMLRGGVPYVDFADHKPPRVFAYDAAAQFLGAGMLPVRLLTVLGLVPLVAFCASAFFGHDRRGPAVRLGLGADVLHGDPPPGRKPFPPRRLQPGRLHLGE